MNGRHLRVDIADAPQAGSNGQRYEQRESEADNTNDWRAKSSTNAFGGGQEKVGHFGSSKPRQQPDYMSRIYTFLILTDYFSYYY